MSTSVFRAPASEGSRSHLRRRPRGRLLAWAILVVLLVVTLFPFFWMVRTAFVANQAVFTDFSLIPAEPTLINFRRVLGLTTVEESLAAGGTGAKLDFGLYLRNSLIFTGILAVAEVGISASAAYAFARLRFKGRDLLFTVFLAGMMVPAIFGVLPNFVLIRSLGWIDTFAGVLAPYLLITPFAIFFLRQFFLGIPREIEEAAISEGAGRVRIFLQVIVPMSTAPLATLAIITAVAAWNEFLWPQLVGKDENVRLLNVAVATFAQSSPTTSPDWAGLMAAASLQVIPMVVLLLVVGRRVVNSIGFVGVR